MAPELGWELVRQGWEPWTHCADFVVVVVILWHMQPAAPGLVMGDAQGSPLALGWTSINPREGRRSGGVGEGELGMTHYGSNS